MERSLPESWIDKILGAESDEHSAAAVDELRRDLRDAPPSEQIEMLLGGLRSRRFFRAMAGFANLLLELGIRAPFVRLQQAQAQIDLGNLTTAESQLLELIDDVPADDERNRSEAYGLLGRGRKQRFVKYARDRRRAASEIEKAIEYYTRCYDADPAWHGANLVALVSRAEREGMATGSDLDAEGWARRLLADLAKIPDHERNAWTAAAAAQAHIALEEDDCTVISPGAGPVRSIAEEGENGIADLQNPVQESRMFVVVD